MDGARRALEILAAHGFSWLVIGVTIVIAVVVIQQGSSPGRRVDTISEEERADRRRRALLRFGNGDDGGGGAGSAVDEQKKKSASDPERHRDAHLAGGLEQGQLRRRHVAVNALRLSSGHQNDDATVVGTLREGQSSVSARGVITSGQTGLGQSVADGGTNTVGLGTTKDAANGGKEVAAGKAQSHNNSVAQSSGALSVKQTTNTSDATDVEPTVPVAHPSSERGERTAPRRTSPPPAQLLCDALSEVCNARVTVAKGGGSWGGEGWIERKMAAKTFGSDMVLPLIEQQQLLHGNRQIPPTNEKEWEQLNFTLGAIVSSSSPVINPFHSILVTTYEPGLVAVAASWHSKAHGSAIRNIIDSMMFRLDKDDIMAARDGLEKCLSTIAAYFVKVLAQWLDADINNLSSMQEDEEESDGEDLFTEYYDSAKVEPVVGSHVNDTTAIGELIDLCGKQDATLSLPRQLLHHVMVQSSNGPELARGILQRALDRLLPAAPNSKGDTSFDSIAKDLAAVSYLITNSVDIAKSLAWKIHQGLDGSNPNNGSVVELNSVLGTLFSLGAYTLPQVGFEREGQSRFYDDLMSCEAFPLGIYAPSFDSSIAKVHDEARSVMRLARSATCRILDQCMRKKGGDGKDVVFLLLNRVVCANGMHPNLLQEQLLNEKDPVHASFSSRPFLSGAAFSVLEMCTDNLKKTYEKSGVELFDARYLMSTGGARLVSSGERRLGDNSGAEAIENVPISFSGATEFFFATHSLLRVAIFPGIRIRNEYASKYKSIIGQLLQMARARGASIGDNSKLPEFYKRVAAGLFGWDSCFHDRNIVVLMVDFSLLQLRFIADLAKKNNNESRALLALLPESMCSQPSQYIAHVATHFQRFLSPNQAEDAVGYATVLLGSTSMSLSVQVRTELMRISMAFINASVQRALSRHKRKYRRKRSGDWEEEDDDFIDTRDLDIYTSLDKNDHGVVVFASPVASKQLGPALLSTFVAMEAVEGLDVEKDNMFHKNGVQSEISDLILRLWIHPSGEFQRSIATEDSAVLDRFFRSLAASISIESDTVYQTILDIRDILENDRGGVILSQRLKMRLDSLYGRLSSFLGALRRLLLLLVYLSQDERISFILGGGAASSDLGIMVVSLLDKFTAFDGGTHPQVDFRVALKRAANISARQGTSLSVSLKELIDARTFSKTEFGLDVSVISHLLIALVSRWSLEVGKEKSYGCCAVVKAIASHEDFDIKHFQSICDRLIVAPQSTPIPGSEDQVLRADGHVFASLWTYEAPTGIGLEQSRRQRIKSASQDQFTHDTANTIASVDQIDHFLAELGMEVQQKASQSAVAISNEKLLRLEQKLLIEPCIEEGSYAESLKEWTVSSDSFGGDHFYDSNSKTSSSTIFGKLLMKDARRCWKDLPKPHPNASVFVCYSEERMDICKALIIGAAGTPYSMGAFLFDISYPQLYPSAPPMVHFMTTGGGQVRFSPNLYNDGKVCLSLLGTTNAWDESQRWNPDTSTLAQVLLSIQSQILDVSEPYFAEGGGHEGLEGTASGQRGSARYNRTLRLSTLRYAILEPLKHPPKGFEDVTRRHFAMCRKRIMVQAKMWVLESKGSELQGRFVKAYTELITLLSGNELACERLASAEDGNLFGALRPKSDDLVALQILDKSVYNSFVSVLRGRDRDKYSVENVDDVDEQSSEEDAGN